jgi:o-succinylbenzoate synthase
MSSSASPSASRNRRTRSRNAPHRPSEGYRRIKLKIEPGADIDYVAAVRQRVGAHAPLMVDANNAYTLDDTGHLARLDDFGLMMIEQPLDADDLVRTPNCSGGCEHPLPRRVHHIGGSRTGHDHARQRPHHQHQARPRRRLRPVPGHPRRLPQHGVPVWCGGMLESGIGRAYNVALASLPGFTMPGDISPSARYWERTSSRPEWIASEPGTSRVPARTGIGVDVDIGRIDDLTYARSVRAETPGADCHVTRRDWCRSLPRTEMPCITSCRVRPQCR